MDQKSILIVEDEAVSAMDLQESLRSLGYRVSGIAVSGEQAIESVRENPPDLILMDIMLSGKLNGIEAAEQILREAFIPIIYITAYNDHELIERVKGSCSYGYILKPSDFLKIGIPIELALNKHETDVRLRDAYRDLEAHVASRTAELAAINRNLGESERRYREIFDCTPDGIIIHDALGNILDANTATKNRLEIFNEGLVGRNIADFVTPDNAVAIDNHAAKSLAGISEVFETRYVSGSGNLIPAEVHEHRIRWNDGQAVLSISRDITKRKEAERSARESRQILEAVLNTIPVRVFWKDKNSVFLGCNLPFARDAGYESPKEVIGKDDFAMGWTDEAASFREDDRAVIESGIPKHQYEETLTTRTGKKIQLLTSKVPLKDASGNTIGVLGTYLDITGRKAAEEALRETERRLGDTLDFLPDATFAIDRQGTIIAWNRAIEDMTGFAAEDMLGKGNYEYSLPFYGARRPMLIDLVMQQDTEIPDNYASIKREGDTLTAEVTQLFPGGKNITSWGKTTLLKNTSGKTVGAIESIRDITERKRAEEALRESEERYRTVVEDQTEFICRFTPDGRLTFVNDAYCRYFGLDRHNCIGSMHNVTIPPEDASLLKKHLSSITQKKPVATIEHRAVLDSGEVRWQRWSDRAIFDENGKITEYQSVGRDITGQKETETELKNSRENLEKEVQARTAELTRANRQLVKEIDERRVIDKKLVISSNEKDLLLREIHHRVKNNLQLISGLLDMTMMRTQDPEIVTTLTDVMLRVQTMAQIHTRLYESKRFDRVDMDQLIQDQMTALSNIYSHKDREITHEIRCPGIYLPVDQAIPCALVLNEVLSNSYKHAFRGRTHGTIEVSGRKVRERLRFIIRDDGVGIPVGFDISLANRLGLKLIRTLVHLQLKGTLTVKRDRGTEVAIEFPIHIMEKNHVKNTYC